MVLLYVHQCMAMYVFRLLSSQGSDRNVKQSYVQKMEHTSQIRFTSITLS